MNKKNCTGCGLCASICPKKCIEMKENKEGFIYPVVDTKKCINCKLCEKKCPLNMNISPNIESKTYAFQSNNKNELYSCASGGAFYTIAKYVLDNGGTVIGVGTNNDLSIDFYAVNKKESLNNLLNSKYFQCELKKNIYLNIKEYLKNGLVLFSGTPCQVAAIVKYLENDKNKDNLISLEILCQGAPSYKVIKYFYKYYEKKENSKIVMHKFRSKSKYVGKNYFSEYKYENGKTKTFVGEDDILTLSFQRNLFLRNSCYNCKFSNNKRVADFTCGDIWKLNQDDYFDLKKGVSVVRCNNIKADKILHKLRDCVFVEVEEEVLKNNVPFNKSVKKPLFRNISYILMNIKIPAKTIVVLGAWKYYLKKIIKRGKI